MVLYGGVSKKRLLLVFFLITISARANDYFTQLYDQINTNIQNGDFEANLLLADQLQANDHFNALDCHLKGKVYHKIGVSLYLAYEEKKAVTYFEKVLAQWNNCPGVPETEKGNTKYNLGISHQYLGNFTDAKHYLDEALTIFEKDKEYPPYELGLKYHGIGLFYESIDDLFRAQLYFSNAISLFEKAGAVNEQFEVYNSAVTLNMDFKDYGSAAQFIDKAIELAKSYPDKILPSEIAPVYLNAATITFEQKDIEAAELLAHKAMKTVDTVQNPFHYAIGLEILAFVHMEKRLFNEAAALLDKVLTIRKKMTLEGSGQNLVALTHENYAELYIKQGHFDRADEHITNAFEIGIPNAQLDGQQIPIIKKTFTVDDNLLIRLLEMKTKVLNAKYENTGMVVYLQNSLNLQYKIDSVIKRGLLSFRFEQSKLDYLGVRYKHYGKAIEDGLRLYSLTEDTHYLEESFQFSAKTKAIVLQQELNIANTLRKTVPDNVLAEEQKLWGLMNEQQSRIFEAPQEARDSLLPSFLKTQNTWESYLRDIEKTQPENYRKRFEFLQLPKVKAIQNQLPGELAIIEFFETKEVIYSFWITHDRFFSLAIGLDEVLKTSILEFTKQCRDPELPIIESQSQYIYELLLKQGLGQLKNVDRLGIIPDGLLHNLSFEALKADQKYLIESYSFNYAYSVSLIQRPTKATEHASSYVGFSSSYSNGLNEKLLDRKRFFGETALTQLTLSKKEVEEASKIFNGQIFLEREANLENFKTHAGNAKVLHLSLHGLVDQNDPTRSCVVFDDTADDFLLSPQDLYKNNIMADLVLLSACHSASGKIYSGEGVQGMTKAFILAGAQNVLSSLWNASETSSLDITLSFLKNSEKGWPLDIALQAAKLDYLKKATPSLQHPYYWSNYILMGKVAAPEKASRNHVFFYIALMLGVGAIGYLSLLYFKRKNRS